MILIVGAALAAGLVDSVIGGGGLIMLPAMMLRLGVHPTAIGTNKMAGACGTLAALAVYGRGGHVRWKVALRFAAWVGAGSVLGAAVSPRFLVPFYPALLGAGSVLCLGTLFFRERLIAVFKRTPHGNSSALSPQAACLGLLCGFYDGAWGPGGGTFMFLTLLYATPLGLMGAIAASKIANFASSILALATYAAQGYIRWDWGTLAGVSLACGSLAGARLALKHAERILTPLLLIVTGLLLWKLWSGLF